MADLRELFHDAAAPPTRPLDVPALLRHAARRPRRWVAWLATLGAFVAVGTPVGLQWASSGSHANVRTLPGPVSTTTTTVSAVAPPLSNSEVSVVVPPGPRAPGATHATPAGRTDAAPSRPETTAASGTSCSVNTDGVPPGEMRTCQFTATTAGGWWAGYAGQQPGAPVGVAFSDPSSVVRVTRAGVTSSYPSGQYGSGCADDIIRAGDVVEVSLRAASQSPASTPPGHYVVGAGSGWDCEQHG